MNSLQRIHPQYSSQINEKHDLQVVKCNEICTIFEKLLNLDFLKALEYYLNFADNHRLYTHAKICINEMGGGEDRLINLLYDILISKDLFSVYNLCLLFKESDELINYVSDKNLSAIDLLFLGFSKKKSDLLSIFITYRALMNSNWELAYLLLEKIPFNDHKKTLEALIDKQIISSKELYHQFMNQNLRS